MFIARVSRGGTIRQFITGILLVPTGFTFMWMTVFGNSAIYMIMKDGMTGLAETVRQIRRYGSVYFGHHPPASSLLHY